jgi:hypothetical protein
MKRKPDINKIQRIGIAITSLITAGGVIFLKNVLSKRPKPLTEPERENPPENSPENVSEQTNGSASQLNADSLAKKVGKGVEDVLESVIAAGEKASSFMHDSLLKRK